MSRPGVPAPEVVAPGDPVDVLRGIGPRWAAELKEKNIATVSDLLQCLPHRYEDRRRPQPLSEARAGEPLTAMGLVKSVSHIHTRHHRMNIFTVILDDGTAALPVVFFNRGYLGEWMKPGVRLVVHGIPKINRHRLELHSPEFDLLHPGEDPAEVLGWIPVYGKLGPLSPRRVRAVMRTALSKLASAADDPFPAEILRRLRLPGRSEAWKQVHRPGPDMEPGPLEQRRTPGHRRLAFEEFFLLELGLALRAARRRAERREGGYHIDLTLRRDLLALLPFPLTGAQQRVLGEIEKDLEQPWPMNRLLMGDVGSGKTVIAALAMLFAARSGRQAVLMAPTEILAHQHAATLQRFFLPAGMKVELLTAGLPQPQQRETRQRAAAGMAQLLIGTHSLISESVQFKRLGLVVIDEQHRFGVVQRADLLAKGNHPDVLVLSATPIPRTLAMVMYGDLEVSILDEKPPGRPPIRTVVRTAAQREQVFIGLGRALEEKRQIFAVHPAVEESVAGLRAAEEGLKEYRSRFPEAKIALVHGRMKSADRQANLDAFAAGRIQILVATTVIEVGIDVPAASVIVVEDADRFGLAQLHQLRGRVGRGDRRSYCVLIAGKEASPEALWRLKVLEETDDGFRVAEKDLEMRGPGELAGTAQSGMPNFQVADLVRHQDLLLAAREEAFRMVGDRPEGSGVSPPLLDETLRRFGPRLRLAEVG